MEFKESAPDGEVPPVHCPVCLEAWNTNDRLPKFLSCHHTVCVTCAGRLQRPAPTPSTSRRHGQSPSTPTSPLARLIANRISTSSVEAPKCTEEVFQVRCPLCRTTTQVQEPSTLQTNFYLWGLLRSPSQPRLVLWCESCSRVASPDCTDHHLKPFPEKLRLLQEELTEKAGEAKRWTQGRAGDYRYQVEVYRWLCGVLRHAHGKVLESLTQAQQTHRRLQNHNQELQTLVKRGEALQKSQEEEEQVVEQLVKAVEEVEEKHKSVMEDDYIELLHKFPVMSTHKAPKGYGTHARVVIEANDSVMLSFYGDECKNDMEAGQDKDGEARSHRSNSLIEPGSRRRSPSRQMVRSRSLLQTKGKSADHLLDPGEVSDNVASRTSTPTSRRSALGVFDADVYEEEASLRLPSPAASTPTRQRHRKSPKNKELDVIDCATGYQGNDDCRTVYDEEEYTRPQRYRGRGGRSGARRRRTDRETRTNNSGRRNIKSLCSLM